jgi:hypothetical protein
MNKSIKNIRNIIEKQNLNLKNISKNSKTSPLHVAVRRRYKEAIELLLNLGANVNITNSKGETPLHKSVWFYDSVKMLLERGARVNARDNDGDSPLLVLMKVCGFESAKKTLELLVSYGANIRQKDKKGFTALHYAIETCDIDIILYLIKQGAPVNAKSKEGHTPLTIALANKMHGFGSRYRSADDWDTIINALLKKSRTIQISKDHYNAFIRTKLDLSYTPTRNTFERILRSEIRQEQGSVNKLATVFGATLSTQDPKYTDFILRLFRNSGALTIQEGTNEKSRRVLDMVFLDSTLYSFYGGRLCHIFKNRGIRLTDALHPFHVLMFVVRECSVFDPFNKPKKLTKIIDYLQSKGFDINESVHMYDSYRGNTKATPISLLETYINKSHTSYDTKLPQKLQSLHTTMVSRGAQTSTGKRQQRTTTKRKNTRDHVTEWTRGTYQNVQNARREGARVLGKARHVNRYISKEFRDSGIRSPVIPREFTIQYNEKKVQQNARPMYLYRGIHGKLAKTFLEKRMMRDTGFIAFSRDEDIAYEFARKGRPGFVMQLKVDSIKKGTPWIWFHPKRKKVQGERNVHISNIDEQEVLLPPGILVLNSHTRNYPTPLKNINWNRRRPTIDVTYIPDKAATNLSGKKKMYRTVETNRNKSRRTNTKEERDATTWFSTLFNSRPNGTKKKRTAPQTSNKSTRRRVS